MKVSQAVFLGFPVLFALIAIILGFRGFFASKAKPTGLVSLSLDPVTGAAYQNLLVLAQGDFKKLILESEEGMRAFKDMLRCRDVNICPSKQGFIETLTTGDAIGDRNAVDLILSLAEIDRRHRRLFSLVPSDEFAETFVKKLLNIENADPTAEYLVDDTFGVEAKKIGICLNAAVKKTTQAIEKHANIRTLKRIFKNAKLPKIKFMETLRRIA